MNGRVIIMGASLLLAAGVIAAAVFLSEPAPPVVGPHGRTPPTPIALNDPELSPDDLTGERGLLAVETAERFLMWVDDGKTVTRLTGAGAVPREAFVADIRLPQADITFDPQEMVRITAAEGTFHYPGNQPQRGTFHHDTVVTVFKTTEGKTVDPQSERDVQFRLYLDDATQFDRELGQIRTQGPVRLVGRDLDFTGTGLSITFNQSQRRIEQLVIEKGHELRLASSASATDNPSEPSESNEPNEPANLPGPGAVPPDAGDPEPEPEPGQTYRVTLSGGVDATVGRDGTTLAGASLRGLFTVRNQTESDASPADRTAAPAAPLQASLIADNPAPTPDTAIAASPAPPGAAATDPADPRSLRLPQPDDTVLHWQGRMVLEPHEGPAPDGFVSGDRGAPQFILTGRPARVVIANTQTLEAARVGYDDNAGRVWAASSAPDAPAASAENTPPATPLTLSAPDFGRLTAQRLELERNNSSGVVYGPGELQTSDATLKVTFADRLDLTFASRDRDDKLPDGAHEFAGLQDAAFVGDVGVRALEKDGTTALDLDTPRLEIAFAPAAAGDDPAPSQLRATGSPRIPVVARQPGTVFTAQQLTVDLDPASDPPSAAEGEPGAAQVTRLRATGRVEVKLDEGDAHLTAHTLDADPRAQQMRLTGQGDQPATLSRLGARLEGHDLTLNQADESAHATGPGRFSAAVDPLDPESEIEINWTHAMTFNNRAGSAHFAGNVRSRSGSASSRTRLDADELDFDFVPQNLNTLNPDDNPAAAPGPPADDRADGLDIRRVHARADPADGESQVNFTTESLDEDSAHPDAPPLTAFTLISRELLFVNQPPNLQNRNRADDQLNLQTVEVPVRGRMLLTDNRTPRGEDTVAFAGNGLTAFAWEDRLFLDALRNDLRIEGQVIMAHKAPGKTDGSETETITLETQILTADLTETGGLDAFAGVDAPAAQLRRVEARGAVRVSSGDTRALADHLDYTASRNTVLFTAEPGKLCQIRQEGQAGGVTNPRSIKWDLATGILEGINAGSGVVPVQ